MVFYSVLEHLSTVFATCPEWDQQQKYKPDNLNVYYENNKKVLVKVEVTKSLAEILKLPE